MATTKSLKPSFLDLSTEKRLELIRENRALRRELKPKPVRKSKSAVEKKTPSLDAMLKSMSPEQAKELFEKLNQRKE